MVNLIWNTAVSSRDLSFITLKQSNVLSNGQYLVKIIYIRTTRVQTTNCSMKTYVFQDKLVLVWRRVAKGVYMHQMLAVSS